MLLVLKNIQYQKDGDQKTDYTLTFPLLFDVYIDIIFDYLRQMNNFKNSTNLF